jgi:hypothetical protein
VIIRLLFTIFATAATTAAESAGPSRLQFTTPEQWMRSTNRDTQLVSLTPPGGEASVTFSASKEFGGTGEQWLHESWIEILKDMKLAGPSRAGREGEFLTRTGEFIRSDGSKPWLCLYALTQDGRGESVIFYGARAASFFTQLPTVNQMIRRIKVGPPISERRQNTKPAGRDETEGTLPVLAYNEPADYYRGVGTSPIEYSSSTVNADVQVYPFRTYTGDIAEVFQRTLLRDWIDPRWRESNLAGAPQFFPIRVRGATLALSARFHENIVGTLNERMRSLIVVGELAALVDMSANSTYSWQKVAIPMGAMLDSMRVEWQAAPPSVADGPGPGGGAVAGLYLATKSKYMANPLGGVNGYWKPALHYYVFSADGRVHCCYDFPPGGNEQAWRRFDFNAAQRADPQNTGRYTIKDNQLFIQMAESLVGLIRDADHLEIQSVTYERQP